MIGELVLYAFALAVGVLFGWSARDSRVRRSDVRPTTSRKSDVGTTPTITVPYYVVHWHREDDLYVALVHELHAATDVDRYEDLHDAVHDLVATRTGSDRFWLDWHGERPTDSS